VAGTTARLLVVAGPLLGPKRGTDDTAEVRDRDTVA
jgi:hypothetical protein